jgi:hypothetical protein
MNKYFNFLIKSTIITIGIIIVLIYFFFEEKNDFFSSSKVSEEEKNRKTNFTKIAKSLHKAYIFLVVLFLLLLYLFESK